MAFFLQNLSANFFRSETINCFSNGLPAFRSNAANTPNAQGQSLQAA